MGSIQKSVKPQPIDVGVCVPSTGLWMQQFGKSLALAFADFMNWIPDPKYGYTSKRLQLLTARSSMLVQSRHNLVKSAMKAGCTHILSLDSDMAFPKDIIQRMLVRDKDILAANCTTRVFPTEPVAYGFDGKKVDSRKKHGLQRVRQAGLAVCMVKRNVFAKLRPPLFSMEWIPDMNMYSGEDVYFTQLAHASGFDVWIDHDLSKEIYHCGFYTYGHDDIGRVMDDTKDKEAELAFQGLDLREQRKFNLG